MKILKSNYKYIVQCTYSTKVKSIIILYTEVLSEVYTLHSTLYTLHSTLYTLHSTLYTLHSTLYTTLYTLHSTLYTLHSTLLNSHVLLKCSYPILSIQKIEEYALYIIHYITWNNT